MTRAKQAQTLIKTLIHERRRDSGDYREKGRKFLDTIEHLIKFGKVACEGGRKPMGLHPNFSQHLSTIALTSSDVSTLNIVKNIFLNQLFTSNVYRDFAFAADP